MNAPPTQLIPGDQDQTFTLTYMKKCTSGDEVNFHEDGLVSITGNILEGSMQHVFTVEPAGNTGFDQGQHDIAGTPLEGTALLSLTMTYGSPWN